MPTPSGLRKFIRVDAEEKLTLGRGAKTERRDRNYLCALVFCVDYILRITFVEPALS